MASGTALKITLVCCHYHWTSKNRVAGLVEYSTKKTRTARGPERKPRANTSKSEDGSSFLREKKILPISWALSLRWAKKKY